MQKKETMDNVNLEGEAMRWGNEKKKRSKSFFSIRLFLLGPHQDSNAFWAFKL